ncbi:S8 family peptidase [bacterium]|nr:S8 family peptidase [bacterium]
MSKYFVALFILLLLAGTLFAAYNRPPDAQQVLRRFSTGCILIKADESVLSSLEGFNLEYQTTMRPISSRLGIYIIKFETVFHPAEVEEAKNELDWERFNELYSMADEQVNAFVELYQGSGLVEWAEPNYILYTLYTPNDPYFVDDGNYLETSSPDQYGAFIMNCEEGWGFTTGAQDVLIAVLDSGVDIDHPDLMGNIWVNPGEDIDHDGVVYDLDDINGVDDDGNGYVDDLNGYDFVGGVTGHESDMSAVEWQHDWNPDIHYDGDDGWGEPDPSVGDGVSSFPILLPADMGVSHGTHCAGIIAAVMDNAYQFAGMAGNCTVMPVRVGHAEGGLTGEGDLIMGIEYAVDNGADVLSISLGLMFGDVPAALEAAIDWAYEQGVTIVCASGNVTFFPMGVSYPASSPYTLAVGSFNSDRETSSFTEYGPELDVLAAGGEAGGTGYSEVIWSTWVASVADEDEHGWPAGSHQVKGEVGTSMACPHAAGLAGLILSRSPGISPDSVYNLIRNTAQDIGPTGWDEQTGYGIVDFGAALSSTGINEHNKPISSFQLGKAYPNPVNMVTSIPYQLETPGRVQLQVYDCLGKRVKELVNQYQAPGKYSVTWQGQDSDGNSLNSGVYLYRLKVNESEQFGKLMIMK